MKISPLNDTPVYGKTQLSILFDPLTMKLDVICGSDCGRSPEVIKRFKALAGFYTGMTLTAWVRDEVAVWAERGFNVFMYVNGNVVQIG